MDHLGWQQCLQNKTENDKNCNSKNYHFYELDKRFALKTKSLQPITWTH